MHRQLGFIGILTVLFIAGPFSPVLQAGGVTLAKPSPRVLTAIAPVVTSISPRFAPAAGGTVVTITGSNFIVGATTVKFGATAGTTVSCASTTQCTATSPAGSSTVSVRVTNALGTSADTSSDDFTYTAPACPDVTFGAPLGASAGTGPASIAVGDFNSDGKSDLAIANAGSNNVSILLGTGSGTFGFPYTNFAAGSSPSSVAIGDFNGDGKSDLAVANSGSNNISILLGNGSGAFGPAANFAVGSTPLSVVVGDFNGDGNSDLAVVNNSSNNVSILLGTGTGTFGAPTNVTVPNDPRSLAIGDFDGDGKSDLAVANGTSNNISILLGTGLGTFGPATNLTAGTLPVSVAVGDFNGDGKNDLAVANYSSNNVSILLNTGSGTFGAATNFAVAATPRLVAIADFNGDGKSDLAVAADSGHISILLGTGSGTLGAFTNYDADTSPIVAAGDFNNDGRTDFVMANTVAAYAVDILLNTAACADLSITKTAVGGAFATQALTYNIAVANAGPSAATAATVTDILPPGATFVSATPTQGTCSGTTTITCNLGGLASGGTANIVLRVTPTATGPLSNTATVSASPADPNGANNSSTSALIVASLSNIPAVSGWAKILLALTAAILGLFMMKKD
ncbi:MAG TPA: FG-GAP-like repeat-containing protein [Thermoanaerobaculia bacterium]|nr:FG-GAP-like repeat-containing protein [Thermoanaerobaculia bacterium]